MGIKIQTQIIENMRLLTSLLLMFFALATYGQGASEINKEMVFANPFHSTSQGYLSILNNKNVDRDLHEYLEFESWTPFEVLNFENEVLSLDSANYFIPERKILFIKDGNMMEVFPDQVQKVRIGTKEYAPFVDQNDENKGLQFFEVIAGKDFKFLKSKSMKEEATDLHPMGLNKNGMTKLVSYTKYYYVREGTETAIGIPRTKSKFIKAFKRHKKKMIKYLEKRKLSTREENDLIVIARYYNFLLNEK